MKISNWDDADKALLNLGGCDREIMHNETDYDGRISSLRERLREICQPIKKTRTAIVKALSRFVRKHQDQLDGRSRKLSHGTVGLKKHPPRIVLELAEETVVNRLKAKKMGHCIRVKEEVNIEALHAYDDETLKALGCKRAQDEEFWYEVR